MLEDRLILLVEDNPDDELLALRALRKVGYPVQVDVVRDGQEALDYFFAGNAEGEKDQNRLPDVVLLDLKLPKLGGLDVLRHLRGSERTRLLPTICLTSSDEWADVNTAYRAGANSYMKKPVDFQEFVAQLKVLGKYWLGVNYPPTSPCDEGGERANGE